MRVLLAVVTVALLSAAAAQAENRVFVIPNDADGYGVDRCLASGASCGATVATAYCQARDFHQAVSYRRIAKDEITGAVPTRASCRGGICEDFVAIECAR
jgi:hypothetical protein